MVNLDSMSVERRYIDVFFCNIPKHVLEQWPNAMMMRKGVVRFYDYCECNAAVGNLYIYGEEEQVCFGLENVAWAADHYGRNVFESAVVVERKVVSDETAISLVKELSAVRGLELMVWNGSRTYVKDECVAANVIKNADFVDARPKGGPAVVVLENLRLGYSVSVFDYSGRSNDELRVYVGDKHVPLLRDSSKRLKDMVRGLR